MSSRLFQEVREKRGLAYTIHSFHWSYSDTGLFGFYAASGGRELPELIAVSLDCLGRGNTKSRRGGIGARQSADESVDADRA